MDITGIMRRVKDIQSLGQFSSSISNHVHTQIYMMAPTFGVILCLQPKNYLAYGDYVLFIFPKWPSLFFLSIVVHFPCAIIAFTRTYNFINSVILDCPKEYIKNSSHAI